MKNLLTILLLSTAFNASASLISGNNYLADRCRSVSLDDKPICKVRITTSSPILMVMDNEVVMEDETAAMKVLAGVYQGDYSFAQSLADDNGITVDEVISAAEVKYNSAE